MRQKQKNPAWQGGALECHAGRPDTPEFTQTVSTAQDLAGPRFERQIELLHCLGPRPTAELLAEIAMLTGEPGIVADSVKKYAGLDPELVRALGADRFPPMPLEVVR